MTLHQLLHRIKFDDAFTEILRCVPAVENHRARFQLAFDDLRSITPEKDSNTVIEVFERSYLGDGVMSLSIDASAECPNIWRILLGGKIKRRFMFGRFSRDVRISDESIVAELLWQLVTYGFPEKSAALSGFILNNRRWPDSTQSERFEEICSYADLFKMSGISREELCDLCDAKNISWISNMTSYTLPREKTAYDMNCFLDDFMWFNDETKTIVMISASDGYEDETSKIEEFANRMLRNPMIVYGKAMLSGIETMAVFITE